MDENRTQENISTAFAVGFIVFLAFFAAFSAGNLNRPLHTNESAAAPGDTSKESSDKWTAEFTGLLVLVGAAQAGLFLWQLALLRQSALDAKIAAEAAKGSADAAKDSSETSKVWMVASDRAYIHFNGCRWISHRDPENNVFWRIRPTWINSGNTPPRRLHIYAHYEFRDDPLPEDYPFLVEQVPFILTTIPPKGIIESAPQDFYGDQLALITEQKKHLYIWGVARYRDVFPDTLERVTKFCVHADAIMGNPREYWDDKDNPVEIRFANYHQHNCADEDCEQGV